MAWDEETIGDCRLIHGDCREVLPSLAAVDAIVTDPPWQASQQTLERGMANLAPLRETRYKLRYGSIGIWDADLLILCQSRCLGDQFYFCGYKELGEMIQVCDHYRGTFVWHKPNGCPTRYYPAKMDTAFIVWTAQRSALYGFQHWPSMVFRHNMPMAGFMARERLVEEGSGVALHPSQMPVALLRALLKPLPIGTVLDPFCGTGTTGVACVEQGRPFIGIEQDARYFDIACRRIEATHAQPDLFVPAMLPSNVQPPLFGKG